MTDHIAVEAPLGEAFAGVVRLIVGGIAERADFGFEAMDDLQLAIERLLAEAGSDGRVSMGFELAPGRIRARIGPLGELGLSGALQAADPRPGSLTLGRVLDTVVDSFGVDDVTDGQVVVRIEKLAAVRP